MNIQQQLRTEMERIDTLIRAENYKEISKIIKKKVKSDEDPTLVVVWLRMLSSYADSIDGYYEAVDAYKLKLDSAGKNGALLLRGLFKSDAEKLGGFNKYIVGVFNSWVGWPKPKKKEQ